MDSFNYKIEISLLDGKEKTLYIGSHGGSALRYARRTGDEKIYLLENSPIKEIIMDSEFWL